MPKCPSTTVSLLERHQKDRADAPEIDDRAGQGFARAITLATGEIGDLNKTFPTKEALLRMGARLVRSLFEKFDKFKRHAAARRRAQDLAFISPQDAERGLAQVQRLVQHRVEHRSEVAGRAVDDLQNLSGRGLLLQGLARLGDQSR